MLNKLLRFVREYRMVSAGDEVVCAVSGGADSVALLFGMYLLAPKLQIKVKAAHFNHGLRGEESDRDEAFVRDFCAGYGIALSVGRGSITAGKKGLEASARDARYAFFKTLPGIIATAHTADDNAETVLMHMLRGSGLRGLGGITPVRGNLIRPMLCVTRQEVLNFLAEYHLTYVRDSSNDTDRFLRNRLRHHVMPSLCAENLRLPENLSAAALRLREDEEYISAQAMAAYTEDVGKLRELPPPLRRRILSCFLTRNGVKEPSSEQIEAAEHLLFSEKRSAIAQYSGDIRITQRNGKLICYEDGPALAPISLSCPGELELPQLNLRILCLPDQMPELQKGCFTVQPVGELVVRARQPGDAVRLLGGTKSLKKLYIDEKIPAHERGGIPVIADELGVLGVYGIGANLARHNPGQPGVLIRFERM